MDLFAGARRARQGPDAASTKAECYRMRELCPNQSISLCTFHPARSPSRHAARASHFRHSPTPFFPFFLHLAGTRGKATGAVLGVLVAVSEVDVRRTAQRLLLCVFKHAECPRSGKERRGLPPLLEVVGGARGVEADGGGAGAGAAAIPGPSPESCPSWRWQG